MPDNPYETGRALDEYLLFHYGTAEETLPWPDGPAAALGFAVRTVTRLLDGIDPGSTSRALDVGCAVGRSSFELSTRFDEVIGIDYSRRFVDAAETLRTRGALAYERVDEGELRTPLLARRPAEARPDRVRFEQGDAMDLRSDLGAFDVVHAANLIDRLADPARFLDRLAGLVRPRGLLLLTSPYTWLETFTPRDRWLGGLVKEGQSQPTLAALRDRLGAAGFSLRSRHDLPFLIREHARKYQWSVAEGTVWTRLP